MAYLGQDEWDYQPRRRPSPHRANRTSFYLNADQQYDSGGGLSRTRSQGAQPRPIINLYNEVYNDNHDSNHVSPPPPGAFPSAYPVAAAPAPVYVPTPVAYPAYDRDDRGRRRDDRLADELHLLRLDAERADRSRSRARSRGRSDASDDYYRYEMEKMERERQWKLDQERIRAESDLKHLKDDMRRRQHDLDEEAERKRIIAEYDKKMRDRTDREKSAERHLRDKIQREEKEAKDKEEEAYQKFLAKQKAEKEKKEAEEKAEKLKLEAEMRKRLAEKGFAGNQIESILSDKKKETTTTSTSVTVFQSRDTPVYAKVHKSYLSIETLKYYDIPYKWDEGDSDYIIILREMDKHETNILFEHTKALREGRLLLEAPKKEKEYAFYRKRDRSKSRNRGEWKSFGILEYKK